MYVHADVDWWQNVQLVMKRTINSGIEIIFYAIGLTLLSVHVDDTNADAFVVLL
jgi:hypothetical protein